MSYSFQNPSDKKIKSYLDDAHTIAIVGLSHRQETASYQVATFLQGVGYRIIPVNPKLVGQELFGEKVYGRLQDVPTSIDIVNVFRRSEFLIDVAKDFRKSRSRGTTEGSWSRGYCYEPLHQN